MRSHPFFDSFDHPEHRRAHRDDESPYDDPGFRGGRDPRGRGPGGHGPRGGHGGPPPWLSGLFGLGRPEHSRGPRVRRGDVRHAILDVLRTTGTPESAGAEPLNGYQVIGQITERSHGAWKPSPGSVYPTVTLLQDEGLVAVDESSGRRSLRLTDAGTAYCEEHADELAAVWAPFEDDVDAGGDAKTADIKSEIGQVMGAVWQIASSGSEAQRRAAVDVLVDTRRRLYGILADGPDQA